MQFQQWGDVISPYRTFTSEGPKVAQEDGLTDLLRRGKVLVNIIRVIDELLPQNDGQLPLVKACYRSMTSQTPIICLLVDLAKIPRHEISMTDNFAYYFSYMDILYSRFHQNINDVFILYEQRQNGPEQYADFAITSNPLSRALVSDKRDPLDVQRIIKCVEHLIFSGADPTQPFLHMTEIPGNVNIRYLNTQSDQRFNLCNGRSLVYVALVARRSIALAAALMRLGATIDDSPTFFTDAMYTFVEFDQIKELIDFFKAHFPIDVIKSMSAPDISGKTPLHHMAIMPPKNDVDKLYAARYLQSDLGLAQVPDNHGTTPLQYAFYYRDSSFTPFHPTHLDRHRLAGQKMIDELDRLQNMEQASLVHGALRNSGLSSEIRGAIAEHVNGPRGASSLESYSRNEKKALDRVRKKVLDSERMSPH